MSDIDPPKPSTGTPPGHGADSIDERFRAVQSADVYTVTIDGEAVLLDEAVNRLHHLNAPAALVWSCLDGRASVAELATELSEELGLDPATAVVDTLAVVRELGAEGLLHGVAATGPPAPDPAPEDEHRKPTGPERFRRSPGALWRRSLDAVIILAPAASEPLTLEGGTGGAIWELLEEPCTLEHLVDVLATAYDADPAVVQRDLRPLLDELHDAGAVELV